MDILIRKEVKVKRSVALLISICFLVLWVSNLANSQDELKIWKEFVSLLKDNKITLEHIRPPSPLTKESQLLMLNSFRVKADWQEWEVEPEIVRYKNLVTFIITLGQKRNSPWTYTFNFLLEDNEWYYRHLEGMFIRLDKIASLPTSEFPDLPEARKAYMRQEFYWGKMIWLFNTLSEKEGKDFAFSIFLDGAGYFLAAKVWIPFFPPSRAFILYLCWEQANLRHNRVTLEKLEDNEAIVRISSHYWALWRQATHVKQQISYEDYRKIYETIWQDRAKNAGWNLKIEYKKTHCVFHFTK